MSVKHQRVVDWAWDTTVDAVAGFPIVAATMAACVAGPFAAPLMVWAVELSADLRKMFDGIREATDA
ncbi:hypothetical protein [Gordonia sp. AC31]|uniref:hypothetical protein n=1 Tax=Gordonia sp. AC31 TaxID=2962571 RepID=UPI0028827309|nr:hypothetical protein [Gordonia sp. AC31]MDT0223448.1 hypothetical protein [Gordonia sp. AC31]